MVSSALLLRPYLHLPLHLRPCPPFVNRACCASATVELLSVPSTSERFERLRPHLAGSIASFGRAFRPLRLFIPMTGKAVESHPDSRTRRSIGGLPRGLAPAGASPVAPSSPSPPAVTRESEAGPAVSSCRMTRRSNFGAAGAVAAAAWLGGRP